MQEVQRIHKEDAATAEKRTAKRDCIEPAVKVVV